jgi:hypothetical protein
MARRSAALLPALAAFLLLAGCSDSPSRTASEGPADPSAPPAGSAAATATPSAPAPSPSPVFAASTADDRQAASGAQLSVTAVRVARHDGYDRVVFELEGRAPGTPGWRVGYEQDPRRDGSGEPVEVEGEATLVVRLEGVGYPFDTGVDEVSSAPPVPGDAEVLRDLELGGVYEGLYDAYLGVRREVPFRVFRLSDPARVVVDLRHE